VSETAASGSPSGRAPAHERDDKQNKKNDEKDLGDAGSRSGDNAESEHTGEECDD
jgi:hypothetical protein